MHALEPVNQISGNISILSQIIISENLRNSIIIYGCLQILFWQDLQMPIYLFSSDRKISKPRINIGEFFRYKCQGIKGKAAVKRGSNVGTCTNYVMRNIVIFQKLIWKQAPGWDAPGTTPWKGAAEVLRGKCCPASGYWAVSYTHLDVYKRQATHWSMMLEETSARR